MNFEAVLLRKNSEAGRTGLVRVLFCNLFLTEGDEIFGYVFQTPSYISQYAVPAVHGFVKSICLSSTGGSSLQDTLRLLTLWFDYGQWHEVYDSLQEGIKSIHIDNWLQVG